MASSKEGGANRVGAAASFTPLLFISPAGLEKPRRDGEGVVLIPLLTEVSYLESLLYSYTGCEILPLVVEFMRGYVRGRGEMRAFRDILKGCVGRRCMKRSVEEDDDDVI